MRNCLILILISFLSIACKNNDKQMPIATENSIIETPSKKLTINFTFKTNKADIFKIMMNNIEVDDLQKKNIQIFEEVIPTTQKDAIVAEFDANNISRNIIIDFGSKELKEVEIMSISVSYGNNHFSFDTAKEFDKYFAYNRFIEKEEDSKILKTKKVDGKHYPAITLRQNLINLLKK